MKQPIRIGTGYDVHCLVENRKMILGGVDIPFDRGLLGHSDASITLNRYVHSSMQMKRNYVSRLQLTA